jgi:hypothetical protein
MGQGYPVCMHPQYSKTRVIMSLFRKQIKESAEEYYQSVLYQGTLNQVAPVLAQVLLGFSILLVVLTLS